MEKTGTHTKALQDIATQLQRIADYMERHPTAKYIIHVNEGATISGGTQDFAEDITVAPEMESNGANSPGVVDGNTHYQCNNKESFNSNSDEALTNLTSTIKKSILSSTVAPAQKSDNLPHNPDTG